MDKIKSFARSETVDPGAAGSLQRDAFNPTQPGQPRLAQTAL